MLAAPVGIGKDAAAKIWPMNVAAGEVFTELRKGHAGGDVLRFFNADRRGRAAPSASPCRARQPFHTFYTGDPEMAGAQELSPMAPSFHADLKFLAEPDRALVQRTHR